MIKWKVQISMMSHVLHVKLGGWGVVHYTNRAKASKLMEEAQTDRWQIKGETRKKCLVIQCLLILQISELHWRHDHHHFQNHVPSFGVLVTYLSKISHMCLTVELVTVKALAYDLHLIFLLIKPFCDISCSMDGVIAIPLISDIVCFNVSLICI